jgi:hypothetical protein
MQPNVVQMKKKKVPTCKREVEELWQERKEDTW